MASEIVLMLQNNPIVLWGGIVLAALIFLVARHMERMRQQEESQLEAPRPSTLDEIVRPKVMTHVDNRGTKPENQFVFKIGRQPKGYVYQYLDTEMETELLNPNPNDGSVKSSEASDGELEADDEPEMTDVRIIRTKPQGWAYTIKQFIRSLLAQSPDVENSEDGLYVFRRDSFLDTPGDDMVLDPDVMSYVFANMEVEITPSARNVVNQAVQTEVSEKLLSALPNYTEKVDFLFPLHSQSMKKIEQEGEHMGDDEGF